MHSKKIRFPIYPGGNRVELGIFDIFKIKIKYDSLQLTFLLYFFDLKIVVLYYFLILPSIIKKIVL